jgi:hypothetical protein
MRLKRCQFGCPKVVPAAGATDWDLFSFYCPEPAADKAFLNMMKPKGARNGYASLIAAMY